MTGTSHKEGTADSRENIPTIPDSEVTRTRLGCIIKKTGQINIWLTTVTRLVDMLATPTNVVWLAALSHDSKCLFVQHFAS